MEQNEHIQNVAHTPEELLRYTILDARTRTFKCRDSTAVLLKHTTHFRVENPYDSSEPLDRLIIPIEA